MTDTTQTAKQRVLARWPDAIARHWGGWRELEEGWKIEAPKINGVELLGCGESQFAAWDDAASRLPAQNRPPNSQPAALPATVEVMNRVAAEQQARWAQDRQESGVDWTDDEAVVRTIYLEAHAAEMEDGSWRIYDSKSLFRSVPLNIGGRDAKDAWRMARRYPLIRDYELAHRPSAEPERKVTWRVDAYTASNHFTYNPGYWWTAYTFDTEAAARVTYHRKNDEWKRVRLLRITTTEEVIETKSGESGEAAR